MNLKTLDVSVRHRPGVGIIDLQGEINSNAEQALQVAYTQATAEDAKEIVLNFSAVDYMNSTGIALVVSILAQARKSNRSVLAYGLSDHYIEIFHITRLSDFINIFPDERSALADIQPVKI